MSNYHTPVLQDEAISYLNVQKGNWYIDCNLGGGGHSEKILEHGGKVLGIDLDSDAINEVSNKYSEFISSRRLILTQSNFTQIDELVEKYDINEVTGILFDLGFSSYQLETTTRGFSFNMDGPLDMRMDPTNQSVKAADLINGLREDELSDLFYKLGEERFSKRIAKKIIDARKNQKIESTNQLSNIILSIHPRSKTVRTHPATKVFQALRIAVNDELNSLKETLPKAFEILKPSGRLVVISFHSLEDRIVKNYFKHLADAKKAYLLTKKPLTPTQSEVFQNPRSRSAKLRVIEKI